MDRTQTRSWENYENTARSDFERQFPGKPWQTNRQGYRYGWEMAHDPRFQNRSYMQAESELKSGWADWSTRHQDKSIGTQMKQGWDDFKDTVRHAFDNARQEINRRT